MEDPDWVGKFLKASASKKLSTKDRKINDAMKAAVILSPEDVAADLATELLPHTKKSLEAAISEADDPEIKQLLQDEHKNLTKLIAQNSQKEQKQSPIDSPSLMETIGDLLKNLWRPL